MLVLARAKLNSALSTLQASSATREAFHQLPVAAFDLIAGDRRQRSGFPISRRAGPEFFHEPPIQGLGLGLEGFGVQVIIKTSPKLSAGAAASRFSAFGLIPSAMRAVLWAKHWALSTVIGGNRLG
ncbi:MAG: hypothetical protein R3F36_16760 [Candidatus Competibacteraceae bacterium]